MNPTLFSEKFRLSRIWRNWWVALPVLWGLGLVWLFSVNMVFGDEWGVVDVLQQIRVHGFRLDVLWSQSNEHRIFFPRIVLMASAVLFDFNDIIHAYIGQIFVLAAYTAYISYFRAIPGVKRGASATVVVLLIGFACYNTMQYENFIWSFQVAFLMVLAFTVIGLYLLDKAIRENRPGNMIAVVGAGVIASYSSMHGLLFWPVSIAAVVLTALPARRPFLKRALLLGLCGAVMTGIYLLGYRKPPWHSEHMYAGLGSAIKYGLAFVGSFGATRYPLWGMATGVAVAAISLLAYIHLVRTGRVVNYVFPLGLILFGFAMAGALAIGRSGQGIRTALASRYSTFSILIYIGLILLVYREYAVGSVNGAGLPWALKPCLTALAVLSAYVLMENAVYLYPANQWRLDREAGVGVLLNHSHSSWEELQTVGSFSDEAHARHLISFLEENGWSVFAKSRTPACVRKK